MTEAEEIGAAVRAARQSAGATQAELAKLMGLTQPIITAIENGVRNLRWSEGVRLRSLIGFDHSDEDILLAGDAMAYRRILYVIAAREPVEIAYKKFEEASHE